MTDIAAFIRARLDEDEAVARATDRLKEARRWVADEDEVYAIFSSLDDPDRCDQHEPGKPNMCEDDRIADTTDVFDQLLEERAEHIARHDPARVLRQVAVLRAIVAVHSPGIDPCDAHDARFETIPCETLEHLAGIWSDHPDFDPGWSAVGSEGGQL